MRASIAILAAVAATALAGCDGSAVVTLTASQTHFLTYRVTLVSVALETANGATSVAALPVGTTVDLARLADVDEVLGEVGAVQGTYTTAVVTLDFTGARIVADDGSAGGVALTPVAASGLPLGVVALTLRLDPKDPLEVIVNRSSSLALDFQLAAANSVNLAQRLVVVRPMIVASTVPLDEKPVLVRGPLAAVATAASGEYTTGIAPFDGPAQAGKLVVTLNAATDYEVDGAPAAGAAGLAALATLRGGSETIAYGSLSGTATTASRAQNVVFDASEVLAGTSARSAGFDRLSGVVTARSGDILTLSAATLVDAAGAASYVSGAATVRLASATAVTTVGEAAAAAPALGPISVGSRIVAFGAASSDAAGDVALDATAGRVRLAPSVADGLIVQAPATTSAGGTFDLGLATLGGRAASAFSFAGTGASAAADATATGYLVATATSSPVNATVGAPIEADGFVAPFGTAPPDFTATTLRDQTTIPALLSIGWGSAGTASPFASLGAAAIVLDGRNASIGARHTIAIGAETIDLRTLSGDPSIVAAAAPPAAIYAIAHATSATVDDYDTYADFATALQAAMSGGSSALALTAQGIYTPATRSIAATAITAYLTD